MAYEEQNREWHQDLLIPSKYISKAALTRKTKYGEKEYRIISFPKKSKYPEYQTYWSDLCIHDSGGNICTLSYPSDFSVHLTHKCAKKGTRYKRYTLDIDEFREIFSQEVTKLQEKEAARIDKENEMRSNINCALILIRFHQRLQLVLVEDESKQIVYLHELESLGRKKIRLCDRRKVENFKVEKEFGTYTATSLEKKLQILQEYNQIYEEISTRYRDFQTKIYNQTSCQDLYKQFLPVLQDFFRSTTQKLSTILDADLNGK